MERIDEKDTQAKQNTPAEEHTEGHAEQEAPVSAREARDRMREQRRRQRRRRVMRNRIILAVIALVLILAVVVLAVTLTGNREQTNDTPRETLAQADVLSVPHLYFDTLVVNAEAAGSDAMTVDEFNQILQRLYDNDYLLVSIRDLADVTENSDGSVTMTPADLALPEGKKPLILSQNDVSYPLTLPAGGYASRLTVDASGNLVSEYQQTDGTVVTGAYDVISCVEAFLTEHPDFSWQGARGIIGISGSSGILGYRTDELFGKSSEEGNIYADYGTFDTASETASAQAVLEVLKEKGWEIACQGYSGISYASEYDLVTADMEQWKQKTEPVVGSTDLLLYPQGTDIASWKDYSSDDQKFTYLKEQGFDYFFNIDSLNPYWVQIRTDYFRQGRMDARTWLADAGLLTDSDGTSEDQSLSEDSGDTADSDPSDASDDVSDSEPSGDADSAGAEGETAEQTQDYNELPVTDLLEE